MDRLIGVIGTSESSDQENKIAEEVGREIAGRNAVVVCGGLSGIMEAVCMGAKQNGGKTIGIIPGDYAGDANKYIDIPIVTGMSHARNIIVVRSSKVIIAISGSYGTLSEIAFALRLNIPVIGINTWDVSNKIQKVNSAKEAVDMAFLLYPDNC